jgi:uncharacterized protein (TIGR03067 family)
MRSALSTTTILAACMVFVTFLPLAAQPAKDKATAAAIKKELARLQGTWQLISSETDGEKMPKAKVMQIRVVFKGGKHITYQAGKVVNEGTAFTIDPTTKPKRAEDTLKDGTKVKAIYQLDGNTLRNCIAPSGKDFPTEFSSKEGQTLSVFKRIAR